MGTHFIVPEHKSSASNLRFIPAGERRMEALNRMTRQQFTAMIESVRRSFDVVVISAPPISPVADALLSVPDATATALIIQSDHRDSLAAGALQQLRERNTTLAGLVLTGADPDIHDTMQDRRFRIALADKPAQRGADVVECEPLITKPTGNKATDAPGDQRKLRSRIGAAI